MSKTRLFKQDYYSIVNNLKVDTPHFTEIFNSICARIGGELSHFPVGVEFTELSTFMKEDDMGVTIRYLFLGCLSNCMIALSRVIDDDKKNH